MNPSSNPPVSQTGQSPFPGFFVRVNTMMDRLIPEELLHDPEVARRATLISRFGTLGSLFGFFYAAFYLAIGHFWGVAIVVLCSIGVALTPWVMRRTKSVEWPGHFFALTLTLGFTGLCLVEGGAHGHAIAWLAAVPLCALLLIGIKPAKGWLVIAFCATGVVVGFDLAGYDLPTTYAAKWSSLVTAAGYLGLVVFMLILGWNFEHGRAQAAEKMQTALKELAASNERLIQLNHEKNEFLGIVAHDLKNPITMILSTAELLQKVEMAETSRKRTGTIITVVKRMHSLVSNLLDVNAIEEGRFISNPVPCDIGELVEECAGNYQIAAQAKQITIRFGAAKGLFARVDHMATAQILDNLISNALKFSPPNTTVHVHAVPEKNYILATVRDEGPGISPEDQGKMFQKYGRLSARPTGNESSNGLGLAIVKRLAEAMSGTIQCHSAPGQGATFALRLPVCEAPRPEPAVMPVIRADLRQRFDKFLADKTKN